MQMDRRDAGFDDGQRAEKLLEAAQVAQTAYWDALRELESELDIEIDGTADLNANTVESLLDGTETRDSQVSAL